MERKAQVVATKEFRPQQGRPVNLWHLAPAGTPPPGALTSFTRGRRALPRPEPGEPGPVAGPAARPGRPWRPGAADLARVPRRRP